MADGKPTPRQIAIALQYEHGKDPAPRVTAKGEGEVAERIVESARAHGVAVESNAALAQALADVELDQQIPSELYRAVAEVIGFVLRLSGPAARKG
jgi:flagellar biosynthesis protein